MTVGTRWHWNESLQKLGVRQRGPYHARHSSVTWALMLAKNLLWVAKQHGHSVEVMLRMYAAWIEGATEADIQAIRNAMEARPKVPLLPFALTSPRGIARQIVLRPLESPNSASSSASSPEGKKLSLEKARKKMAERVGLLAAGDGRSSSASLRTDACASSKNRAAIFVEPSGFVHTPAPPNKKGLKDRPFLFGGEGGIRTHVPELPDHPISSRRRYDHFGTSPINLKLAAFTYVVTAFT